MGTKTTGGEIKRFYADPKFWPEDDGTYHEEEEIIVDGKPLDDNQGIEDIPDSARVVISGGIVLGPNWAGNEPSFEAYFKRWKKQQATSTLVVECDSSKRDAVVAAIKAAGGRVV